MKSNNIIVELREVDKLTYEQIGKVLGISGVTARQQYMKEKRIATADKEYTELLEFCNNDYRVFNAFKRKGVNKVYEILELDRKPRNIGDDKFEQLKDKAYKYLVEKSKSDSICRCQNIDIDTNDLTERLKQFNTEARFGRMSCHNPVTAKALMERLVCPDTVLEKDTGMESPCGFESVLEAAIKAYGNK